MLLRRVAALRQVRATGTKDEDVVPHRVRDTVSRVIFRVFQLVLDVAGRHGRYELYRVLASCSSNFLFDWIFGGDFDVLVMLLGVFDHRDLSVVFLNLLLLFGGHFRGRSFLGMTDGRQGQLLHRFVRRRKKRASGFNCGTFF